MFGAGAYVLGAILVALGTVFFLILKQSNEYGRQVKQLKPKIKLPPKSRGFKTFTVEEVAKHCTRDDAWRVVDRCVTHGRVFCPHEHASHRPEAGASSSTRILVSCGCTI